MTYYGASISPMRFAPSKKHNRHCAGYSGRQIHLQSRANTRTVSQLLIHLAVLPAWQQELHSQRVASLEGYDFSGRFVKDKAEEQVPRTKAEISTCSSGRPRRSHRFSRA